MNFGINDGRMSTSGEEIILSELLQAQHHIPSGGTKAANPDKEASRANHQLTGNTEDKCVRAKSCQLCPTLCNPMDCSPPGSSVHGILQARILEWVAMPSSRGSSQPRDQTCVSYIYLHCQVGSLPLAQPEKPSLNLAWFKNSNSTVLVRDEIKDPEL